MSGPFRPGDQVRWRHAQGTSEGTVKQVCKDTIEFADQTFRGTEDDPVYIVESVDTGARAAHKAEGLDPVT